MGFSDRLAELLKEKKITWKTVSQELKIGINQKRYWETHDNMPDGDTLKKLSEYFGVSVAFLMCQSDDRGNKKRLTDNGEPSEDFKKAYGMLTPDRQARVRDAVADLLKEQLQES